MHVSPAPFRKANPSTSKAPLRYREVETEQQGKQRIAEVHDSSLKRLSEVEHPDDPAEEE